MKSPGANPFETLPLTPARRVGAPRSLLGSQGEAYARTLRQRQGMVIAPASEDERGLRESAALLMGAERRKALEQAQEAMQYAEVVREGMGRPKSSDDLRARIEILRAKVVTRLFSDDELAAFKSHIEDMDKGWLEPALADWLKDEDLPTPLVELIRAELEKMGIADKSFFKAVMLWRDGKKLLPEEYGDWNAFLDTVLLEEKLKIELVFARVLRRQGEYPNTYLNMARDLIRARDHQFDCAIPELMEEYIQYGKYHEAYSFVTDIEYWPNRLRVVKRFVLDERISESMKREVIAEIPRLASLSPLESFQARCLVAELQAGIQGEAQPIFSTFLGEIRNLAFACQTDAYVALVEVCHAWKRDGAETLLARARSVTFETAQTLDMDVSMRDLFTVISKKAMLYPAADVSADLYELEQILGKSTATDDVVEIRKDLADLFVRIRPEAVIGQIKAIESASEAWDRPPRRPGAPYVDHPRLVRSLCHAAHELSKRAYAV